MGGPVYARAAMDMDQAINFALRKADINSDNKLSFVEFKQFMLVLRQPQLATHTANLIFSLFDVNRDLCVDQMEFRQIYRFYLGRNPTEVEFQEEWARLDTEDRGRVSREDYVRWLQTSNNPVFKQHAPSPTSKTLHLPRALVAAASPPSSPKAPRSPKAAAAATAEVPWRPWHAYSNMSWAQVNQKRPGADDMMFGDVTLKMSNSVSDPPIGLGMKK